MPRKHSFLGVVLVINNGPPYCPDRPIVLLFSGYVTEWAILKHRHYVIMYINMEPLTMDPLLPHP